VNKEHVLFLKLIIHEFLFKPNPDGTRSGILSSLGNGFMHKMEHTVRLWFFIWILTE